MLLLQETTHVRITPFLLGAPRPSSLWPYFSCLPRLLNFSDRPGKEQQKDTKLERKPSQDADSGVWSKGSCSTLQSSNLSLVFQNGSENSALFPLLPEPAAELCQVQKLTRLLHSNSLWLAARETSAGRVELPGMPAASCPCLLLSAPQPAGERSMETSQLPGCRMQRYERASRMGSQLGGCWGTEQERAMSWKNGKPEAGDGLRHNYWWVIILETNYFCRLQTFFFLIKCQISVFVLSPPHFCNSKNFQNWLC